MSRGSLRQRLKARLINRADKVQENLRILLIGLAIFLIGFLTLVVAQFLLPESLSREMIALSGLVIAVIGAIVAAFGYISLSILRIFRFLLTDQKNNDR